jgi:hypothetical protein
MRAHWALLEEEWFRFTGPDWLLLLLDRCPTEQQDHVKLILWRAWTVHNNITHQSGSSLISDSVFFLLNYSESCEQAKKKEAVVSSKGKEPCSRSENRASADVQRWKPPPVGWSKINFDGSFVEHTGEAGVGVIARNHQGEVIFTAWRCVPQCTSAIEVEANHVLKESGLLLNGYRGLLCSKQIVQECTALCRTVRTGLRQAFSLEKLKNTPAY